MSFGSRSEISSVAVFAVALVVVVACSAPIASPTSCHDDGDCPSDAHCLQATCTADRPPRAVITGPRGAIAGTALTFDGAASTDADDEIVAYTWSVRVVEASCAPDLGTSDAGSFHPVFGCPGLYEVILVVRDRTGVLSEPAIAPVNITNG